MYVRSTYDSDCRIVVGLAVRAHHATLTAMIGDIGSRIDIQYKIEHKYTHLQYMYVFVLKVGRRLNPSLALTAGKSTNPHAAQDRTASIRIHPTSRPKHCHWKGCRFPAQLGCAALYCTVLLRLHYDAQLLFFCLVAYQRSTHTNPLGLCQPDDSTGCCMCAHAQRGEARRGEAMPTSAAFRVESEPRWKYVATYARKLISASIGRHLLAGVLSSSISPYAMRKHVAACRRGARAYPT